MNIPEIYTAINAKLQGDGLPPLSQELFLMNISLMECRGHIEVDNGEVRPGTGRIMEESNVQ